MGVIDLQNYDSITEFENYDIKVYMMPNLPSPMNQTNESSQRLDKAWELIRLGKVSFGENPLRATVEGTKDYSVNIAAQTCTCKDHIFRDMKCKHIWAAELQREILIGQIQVKN